MDNSFIKLHRTIEQALSLGKAKSAQISLYNSIILSPNQTYLQITNVDGGISFEGNFKAKIVDSCDNVLKDITNNVFISESTTSDGINQMAIEIVNIGKDFFGRAVLIKIYSFISNDSYYSNPLIISDKYSSESIRFDYWNPTTIDDTHYSELPFKQSINLRCNFTGTSNESENSAYYQISKSKNISTRYLEKIKYNYLVQNMILFSYERLLRIFKQNSIYIDTERITDKPILDNGELLGKSTLINTSFSAYIDESDTYNAGFQIYEGFKINELKPLGIYTLDSIDQNINAQFNGNIRLNTGTLRLYDASDDSLIHSFNESEIEIDGGTNIDIPTGVLDYITTVGNYYILFDSGLVSNLDLNIDFEGINDKTIWTFEISSGQYDSDEYNNYEYLT